MVKHELLVTSWKLKSTSWNSNVEVSNSRITSSNVRVTSPNPRVTSSRIIKAMKTQVNTLEIFSFPKVLSLKLFGYSWGNSYSQFLVIISLFYFSTILWLQLQQGTKWVSHTRLKILLLVSVTLSHINDVIIVPSN